MQRLYWRAADAPGVDALRAAAAQLLREQLGISDYAALPRETHGKPYLPDGPFFSLSHSGGLAVLLISGARCGVDVEPVGRTAPPHIRARLLTPEESAVPRTFAWFWTRKEAAMKLDGRGTLLPAHSVPVLGDALTLGGRRIALSTQIVAGHFISCATERT